MPLPGERHVERARAGARAPAAASSTRRAPRPPPSVGLNFLAAERAAHAEALDGDLMFRHAEHARDDLLRLGRMLVDDCTAIAAALVEPGDRRLRLQVEVLLPPIAARHRGAQRSIERRTDRHRDAQRLGEIALASIACSIVRMAGSGA
jgi:hypothetical protein